MTTATHNYGWLMPDPGGSANTWGNTLNGTTQAIDAKVQTINSQVTTNTIAVSRGPDNGAAGAVNFLSNVGGQVRWSLFETSEPEGAQVAGQAAGTNFVLDAFDNSGAFLGTAFEVIRSTQSVSFSQAVSVGTTLTVNGAATVGTTLTVNGAATVNGVITAGNYISSSVGYQCKAGSGGSFDGNMFNIEWPGSQAHLWIDNVNQGAIVIDNGSAMTIVANITGNGSISAHGDIWGYSGNIHAQAVGGGNANLWFVNNAGTNVGVVYYTMASNLIAMQNQIGGGQALIDGVGNFSVNGPALKPGGGAWAATSDARIKNVMGSYSAGLDEIAKLNPVRFTYKGNDGAVHALVKGKEFIGLVADEAMRAMPEMVSLSDGEIDGRKVNDLKVLDPTALIYALVNSVKELKAEIEALKAAR